MTEKHQMQVTKDTQGRTKGTESCLQKLNTKKKINRNH